jgi:hypothetical protein
MPVVTLETGSNIPFEVHATLDTGLPWNLTGATVTLTFRRPDGTRFTRLATVTDGPGGVARYVSTTAELDVPGYWCRQWTVTDALGTTDNSAPVWFNVEAALSVAPSAAPPPDVFVLATRRVNAGTGLAGGGALSADVTLSLPAVGTPGTYGDATHYPVITLDAQGRVTAVSVQLGGGGGGGVSSFNARTGAVTLAAADVTGAVGDLNALAYGAVADGRTVADAAVTSGATALTSATAGFTALDVGKPVCLALVRTVTDAAITTGTATLTSATANFTAADVGKRVVIPAAGGGVFLETTIASVTNATTAVLAANASITVSAVRADVIATHNTTIAAYVSATQVTLAAPAPFTFAGASLRWGTDNRAALAAALAAAASTGKTLYIPSGTWFVLYDAVNTKLSANADVCVRGAGRERTVLLVGPEAPDFILRAVEVFGHRRATLSDFTVWGPVTFGTSKQTVALQVTVNTAGTGVTRISRVDVWGCLCSAFNADAGVPNVTHAAEIAECDWTCGYQVGASYFMDANADNVRRLHVRDCYIHGSWEHAWYIHPHVPYRLTNVRFEDWGQNPSVSAYGVHCFGGGNPVPLYQVLEGCSFKVGAAAAGVLSAGAVYAGRLGTTHVTDCVFNLGSGVGISLHADALVENCRATLAGGSNVSFTTGILVAGNTVVVRGCFVTANGGSGGIATATAGTQWYVSDCDVRLQAGFSGSCYTAGASTLSDFEHCRALGANTSGQFGFNVTGGSDARVRNCTVTGSFDAFGGVSVNSSSPSVPVRVLVHGTAFDVGAGRAALRVGSSSGTGIYAGVVEHHDNTYVTGTPQAGGTGNYAHGRLARRLGAALASAASLSVPCTADTYHVTGTATVTTVHVEGALTTSVLFHGAVLRLIADGAWALATGGNVQPKASGVAKAVNSVTTLLYDAAAGFWYEV